MWSELRPGRPLPLIAALALAFLLAPAAVAAAGPLDPSLRFRSLPTEHFVIYFHQGEDTLAARLAAIAEETWDAMARLTDMTPPERTHVMLVDQTELANGFATPLPYNTIYITAAWPDGSDFIGNADDWLRLVFTHEFTHIAHLDRSGGWARVVRAVFGRTVLAYPNLFLPTWQIEGLATYYEGAGTANGRLTSGDFAAVTREAAAARRLEPLDRVNGGLVDWPDGHAPYAYGAGFHAYLARIYGAGTFSALADATARRLPYFSAGAFERVYGKSLGALWREYQLDLLQSSAVSAPLPGTRVTHHRFIVAGPRFISPEEVVYTLRTPHAFPTMNAVALDGSKPRALASRFRGSTAAVTADTIVFDQQEILRNTGEYSDLHAYDRRSGDVRRLTREARLLDPDVSPDGHTLVCVQSAPGRRNLVLVRLKAATTATRLRADTTESTPTPEVSGLSRTDAPAVTTLISEPETQFAAPRWSPDGRTIAVERHRRGGLSEIVLVDAATAEVRVLASPPDARVVTPAWRRDGRAVIAAMSPRDEPFNLVELPIDAAGSPRPLTRLTGGATWPDVSPDGQTIIFVGYTAEGYDLYTIPYTQPGAEHARPLRPGPPTVPSGAGPGRRVQPVTHPYSPWSTLKPTSWFPLVESDSDQLRIGATVWGFDVLGYHAYSAAATWLVSRAFETLALPAPRADWQLSYVYARWQPAFWAAASTDTSFFGGPPAESGEPSRAIERERRVAGGVAFPVIRARTSQAATASLHYAVSELTLPSGVRTRNRTALRAAWAATTAHTFGYSISRERGVAAGATAEFVRRALGAFADATTVTADTRAYLPGAGAHHVVALRIAGGASTGHADVRRALHLGGSGPNLAVADFASDAISLLRGFGASRFAGARVALLNAEYRIPLAWPQRGVRTWPLFLRAVHAAAFADVGHAWTRAFRAADVKTSLGAELSADVVAGYHVPLTVTIGAAAARDGAAAAAGTVAYVRIGRAF